MQKVEAFQSTDGHIFRTKEECERHENYLKSIVVEMKVKEYFNEHYRDIDLTRFGIKITDEVDLLMKIFNDQIDIVEKFVLDIREIQKRFKTD